MPLPGLEWYNSLQRSMQDLFKPTPKQHEFSPQLSSIQSLKERSPGGKQAELNYLIIRTIEGVRNKPELLDAREYRDIAAGFMPLVRTSYGVLLKHRDLVAEGLQSEDYTVVKRALQAQWFLEAARDEIEPEYYTEQLLPRVSLRTRRALIKCLAKALLDGPKLRAEIYFQRFFEAYGLEASLPILASCSSQFIYDEIIKHRIKLPVKLADQMFERNPELVIKYLHLANRNKKDNEKDRRFVEVRINDYDTILPKLIKKYPRDFIQLYELTPDKELRLGSTKAERFLKSSKNVLVRKPRLFLKMLPLKLVSKCLNKDEFDQMFVNLFPQDLEDFNLEEILGYLKYYKYGNKIQLLKSKFKAVYDTDFITEKYLVQSHSKTFAEALENDERATITELLLEKYKENPEIVFTLKPYLPPEKLIPILKSEIKHMVSTYDRADAFGQMIISCKIYRDVKSLLQVFDFYYNEHKNETITVLETLFLRLEENFEWSSLNGEHWRLLMKIVRHVHAKNELFNKISMSLWVLTGALKYYLVEDKGDVNTQNEIIELLVSSKVEYAFPSWNTFPNEPVLERQCIEKFFEIAPIKYPPNHTIWEDVDNRLSIALNVIKAMKTYNQKNFPSSKRSLNKAKHRKKKTNRETNNKLKIEDYTWIKNLVEEFLPSTQKKFKCRKLIEIIEKDFPEFYASRQPDTNAIQDIDSGKALALLHRDPKKILVSWEAYLQRAAQRLHAGSRPARRFVLATRWHSEIPIKFVEQSLLQVKERGYAQVLGLLLEGPVLEKALVLPETDSDARESFERARSILAAIRLADPPVHLEILGPFLQPDYASLIEPTLSSLSERVPAEKLLEFTGKLADMPRTSLRKLGIRLYRKAATIEQLTKFLETRSGETVSSVRLVVAKTVMDVFSQVPSKRTWLLAKNFIDGLTLNDKDILESVFCDTDRIDVSYLSDYMGEFVEKIGALCKDGLSRVVADRCFCLAIEALSSSRASFLSKGVMGKILERYFFDLDSPETSRVVQKFAITTYLLPAKGDFMDRLQTIVDAFKVVDGQFDKPHDKHPRFYPVNFMVRRFFTDAVIELARDHDRDRTLRIIDSSLGLFATRLTPSQEPSSYLTLCLFREYLLSATPKEFGGRCAKRTQDLANEFSPAIVRDVADCLSELISDTIVAGDQKIFNYHLTVIEGIVSVNCYYGLLLATMMLNSHDVESYDDRYDNIIEILRKNSDKAIELNLYKHLNKIAYFDL